MTAPFVLTPCKIRAVDWPPGFTLTRARICVALLSSLGTSSTIHSRQCPYFDPNQTPLPRVMEITEFMSVGMGAPSSPASP